MQTFIEEFIKECEKNGLGPWEVQQWIDGDEVQFVVNRKLEWKYPRLNVYPESNEHFLSYDTPHVGVVEFDTPQQYAQKVIDLLTDKH